LESTSRASVLETLLTAHTRLVLQTASYRRQKRKKHADRHENIDARKWRLEQRAEWGVWGSFLIAAAALKTPTRNGYNAQGVNLTFSKKKALSETRTRP